MLVSLAGIIWGTIGPGAHVVHDRSELSPLTVTAYRAVAAVAVLGAAVLLSGRQREVRAAVRREWRRVLVVGVLTAMFQMLFFVGVVFTGVSLTTVVTLGFAPVLLLVLGGIRERRAPGRAQVVTVVVAVAGLLLVTAVRGDAFTSTDAVSWLLILYLGVVTLAVAYGVLFTGLRTTPSGAAVVATLLEPVTAVLIAVAFLGEQLTLAGAAGSLLIVAAITSLGRSSDPPPPQ